MSFVDRDPLANPAPLIERVYGYVAYRIGGGAAAEDVTSDVFERALRYRDTFDPARGTPASWLVGIARRCIADAVAARPELAAEPPEVASPEDLETETLRRLDLAAAVATLDERDRELLALRFGGDLTARQIAELSGERTNTIEVALHRALSRLRTRVDELEADGAPLTLEPVRV